MNKEEMYKLWSEAYNNTHIKKPSEIKKPYEIKKPNPADKQSYHPGKPKEDEGKIIPRFHNYNKKK